MESDSSKVGVGQTLDSGSLVDYFPANTADSPMNYCAVRFIYLYKSFFL
jgi:hypothetical protein